MFAIAHLTDTHAGGRPESVTRLRVVIDHLLAMEPRPDVMVVTGDLTDHGTAEEYAAVREQLDRWPGPVAACPGNHDVLSTYEDGIGPAESVLEVGRFRFVMLNSLVRGSGGERDDAGELNEASLRFLDETLAGDDRDTFVCVHHPPVSIGNEPMDTIMLRNGDALHSVISRHPHVRAVLTGHDHNAIATTFAGRPLLVGGGIASAVAAPGEPLPFLWWDAPITFAVHLVDDDGRLITQWRALPPVADG